MILDVGCGTAPKGDINVDCFREGQNLQIGIQLKGEYVNPHAIPNFVVADAEHLPFKNQAFSMVFSSHTIEHVENPFAMFMELHRVAERKVIVRCPHRRGSGAKRPFHLWSFDEEWFKIAANYIHCNVNVRTEGVSCPFMEIIKTLIPMVAGTPIFKVFRHIERRFHERFYKTPFELQVELWRTSK